ncbi:MAG: hypothetical protein IJO46_00675 [Thermoguttaceae bacterium]|nr:hypothetical protein [Thermoguttaceae bacterium]
MSSKFNVGRRAPFVAASLSFFLYWVSLPPSWIGWAVFLVPAVWAATVFNPDFAAFVRQNGKNAQVEGNSEKSETGKKRPFRRTRRLARFLGRVFFGGEYRQYWTAAFCFWAATVVWISYPHPATTLGWLAASAYLAIYFPLFVAITRALTGEKGARNLLTEENRKGGTSGEVEEVGESAQITQTAQAVLTERNGENETVGKAAPVLTLKVRRTTQGAQTTQLGKIAQETQKTQRAQTLKRFGLPLWLAAPVAWTAVEWLRNRGLGGFSFAGLSHSVYDVPQFIQIAEPFGEYGVGAAIVAIGTLLGTAVAAAVSRSCASKINDANKTNKTNEANEANKAKEANGALGANDGESAGDVNRRKFDGAKWKRVAFPFCGAVAIFGAVVGFGVWRLEFFDAAERSAVESGAVPCRVALLQDGTTYRFPVPDWQNTQVAETYLALAAEAGRDAVGFDVVVWPESCFDVFWDEKTTAEPANGGNAAASESDANWRNAAVSEGGANSKISENRGNAGKSANSAVSATAEVERIARAEKLRALSRSRRDAARLTERLGASAILGTTALLVDVDAGDETTVFNAAVFAPRLDSATVAALGGEYVDFDAAVPRNEAGKAGGLGGLGESANAAKSGSGASWGKYVDWKTPASTAPNDPNPAIFRLYGKRRLVICGEYIPGADLLPDWFPLKAVCADFSLERGAGPVVFPVVRRVRAAENGGIDENGGVGEIGGVGESVKVGAIGGNEKDGANGEKARNRSNKVNGQVGQVEPLLFAPHICFESSIPHYVKEQVRELTAVGAEPDVLVCLSNDGWFRNGSQTDGHLATQVFRAVENRKPVVAATHGGFSAHIDQAGRVRSRGARGGTEVVAAEVLPVDCERLGKGALLGGRDLAETFALVCVLLGLGALVVRKVGGRREKLES